MIPSVDKDGFIGTISDSEDDPQINGGANVQDSRSRKRKRENEAKRPDKFRLLVTHSSTDQKNARDASHGEFSSDFHFSLADSENTNPWAAGGLNPSSGIITIKRTTVDIDQIIQKQKADIEDESQISDQVVAERVHPELAGGSHPQDVRSGESQPQSPPLENDDRVKHRLDSTIKNRLDNDGQATLDDADRARQTGHEKLREDDELSEGNDSAGESDVEESLTTEEIARRKAFFAPETNNEINLGKEDDISFQSMSLSRPILRGLTSIGFMKPTPIQSKTVPMALLGKDIVGGAVTGSGKTAAFLLPILERLLFRPKKIPTTRVGILMPTRELAVQCFNVATKLAQFTDVSLSLLVGGLSVREQEQTLKRRPDIVVATPGRFIDHMRNTASFSIEGIEILVLDEADRMLEEGFTDELNEIFRTIPRSRQTMLFSATMTENIDKLIRAGLNQPVRLLVDSKQQTVSSLTQEFIKIKGKKSSEEDYRRLAYLIELCKTIYTSKTIVFFSTKASAHRAKVLLSLEGINAAEIHGNMSQQQRLSSIQFFREGSVTHLLATDVASRGLDIPRVDTVINYSVPTTTTVYLHRVGRTARAGRAGVACTLYSSGPRSDQERKGGNKPSERALLKPIIKLQKLHSTMIRTRKLDWQAIEELVTKVKMTQPRIESILQEEKEERVLQQTERDVTKGENLIKYEDEIASRPRRTWYKTESEKRAAESKARASAGLTTVKDGKRRSLSKKEKKKLHDRDERRQGEIGKKKTKADKTRLQSAGKARNRIKPTKRQNK